jgi:hypothetical protein
MASAESLQMMAEAGRPEAEMLEVEGDPLTEAAGTGPACLTEAGTHQS